MTLQPDNRFCLKQYSLAELRKIMGMSQTIAAQWFGIPVRTWERWESGRSAPAPYLLDMMNFVARFHFPARFQAYEKKVNEPPNRDSGGEARA